jgi:hypothetical protein
MDYYNNLPTEMNWMEIFRDFTKYSKQVVDSEGNEIHCKRPNAYVWAGTRFNLNTPNMSNEVNHNGKPIFFDRATAMTGGISGISEISYPVVAVTDRTIQVDNYFSLEPKGVINSGISILDRSQSKNCTHTKCTSRSDKEITDDCHRIFKSLLNYIDQLVYDQDDDYWIEEYLANHNHCLSKSKYLNRRLNEENKDILGRFVYSESVKDLVGIIYNLNLPYMICKEEKDYVYRNYVEKIGLC